MSVTLRFLDLSGSERYSHVITSTEEVYTLLQTDVSLRQHVAVAEGVKWPVPLLKILAIPTDNSDDENEREEIDLNQGRNPTRYYRFFLIETLLGISITLEELQSIDLPIDDTSEIPIDTAILEFSGAQRQAKIEKEEGDGLDLKSLLKKRRKTIFCEYCPTTESTNDIENTDNDMETNVILTFRLILQDPFSFPISGLKRIYKVGITYQPSTVLELYETICSDNVCRPTISYKGDIFVMGCGSEPKPGSPENNTANSNAEEISSYFTVLELDSIEFTRFQEKPPEPAQSLTRSLVQGAVGAINTVHSTVIGSDSGSQLINTGPPRLKYYREDYEIDFRNKGEEFLGGMERDKRIDFVIDGVLSEKKEYNVEEQQGESRVSEEPP